MTLTPAEAMRVLQDHLVEVEEEYWTKERLESKSDTPEKIYVRIRSDYRVICMLMNRFKTYQGEDKYILKRKIVFRVRRFLDWIDGFDPPPFKNSLVMI
ncbi:hypothetical protein AALP_AAs62458U000100 [Arabis alpina]|uniref:Uncharacterized protein n=1 Tax=Arabis alpina TaxID=50452 RepID=A0A087FYL4_ARAAL|nr:hypothetical protein AALP_AAs62458U000100 [Arabis alpina]